VHAGVEAGKAGRVSVRWRAEPLQRRAVLEVDDEGAGVAEHLRERIFEPYVTFKAQGTGLGLAICKKIALEHRGTLLLSDVPSPAGGARFSLSLPLADGEGEAIRVEGE
jgi:signal transduction histidine kinase